MNKDLPLISIIIPIYNAEKYLKLCLESIKRQTFGDFEVLMINDGSTDDSEKVCKEYLQSDNRFLLINQHNQGACVARNTGLLHARGEYISFIDADDWIEADFYEVMYYKLNMSKADIGVCDILIGDRLMNSWDESVIGNDEIFREYFSGKIMNRLFNKLYKKQVVENIFFPEGRDLMEDGVFMVQVLAKAKRVIRLKEGLYHYREVSSSLMHKRHKSENQMQGYYANVIERLHHLIFLCPGERDKLLDELLNNVKNILLSKYELSSFGIYDMIREELHSNEQNLRSKYKEKEGDLWLIDTILNTCQWEIVRQKFIKKCIFSFKFGLKNKIKAIRYCLLNCSNLR